MKIFRILGIALTAVLICVNFTSCSKDDDSSSSSSSGSDIPNNTIHYQTNDGVIIRFENEDVFGGAKIISNTYSTTKGYGTIEFASEVTAIEKKAFYKCGSLTSITIPNSVVSIGDNAFYECGSLTSITIPNSVDSIGDCAFFYCSDLTSVTIPSSVTSIGSFAFNDCSGLTSIVVEDGNSVYDSRNNCNAIIETSTNTLISGCKTTKIPNSLTSIGKGAFSECSGLTSVTIPNSVTSIGEGAFKGCSGLTSMTIPEYVKSIGEYAFFGCSGLMDVHVLADSPADCSLITFSLEMYEKSTLYVPESSVSLYKSTDPWSSFSNIKAIPKK